MLMYECRMRWTTQIMKCIHVKCVNAGNMAVETRSVVMASSVRVVV